jgi:hypothetical protein
MASSGKGLSSFQFRRGMVSRLNILRNTLEIINESVIAIKYQTTFVNVSS